MCIVGKANFKWRPLFLMYLPGTSNFTVIKLPLISRTMCLVPTIARRAHFSRSPLSAARVLLREPHSSFPSPLARSLRARYTLSLERFLKRLRLIFLSLSFENGRRRNIFPVNRNILENIGRTNEVNEEITVFVSTLGKLFPSAVY